jgi:preprotein translocase subunit SecE
VEYDKTVAVTKNPAKWAEASREFVGDVQAELRKVAWPTQEETVRATIGVLVVLLIIGAALSLVDAGLSALMEWVLPS